MREYEPTIAADNFKDPIEASDKMQEEVLVVAARSHQERPATNMSDLQMCRIEKLWLTTPGKPGPEDKSLLPEHAAIPAGNEARWKFAPQVEHADIRWELKGRLTSDQKYLADPVVLKIELFTRTKPDALWTKTLEWKAGTCPVRGKTEFDGRLAEDLYLAAEDAATAAIVWSNRADFPEGVLTIDQSPYKVKLSLVKAGLPRSIVARWVYLDVLVHSLAVYWGDTSLLPPSRPDVHPTHQERILGHKKDLAKPGDKDVAGYEELLLEELKEKNAQPTAGKLHEIKLNSDLYAFQLRGQENKEAYELNADFTSYRDLWGNGARIPLLLEATIKQSNGEATDKIPAALGGAKILWDWEDNQPQRWKDALNAGKAPKTEPFLADAFQRNNDARPAALSNCPAEFGGNRGAAGAASHVFPAQPLGNGFLVEVQPCGVRQWAALSSFGTGKDRDTSGVIFQPSRFAGDSFTIKAYLQYPHDVDSADKIEAPPELQTESFQFKVFRRIHLRSLVRGAGKLRQPPGSLVSDLQRDYLKELDMEVVETSSNVNNDAYKAALLLAIDRVCQRTHFPDEVKIIPFLPLLAREAVNTDPPADSAGIVYRDWAALERRLEAKFLSSKIRLVNGIAPAFADEEVHGQTSGAQGMLLTVAGQRYLLYPASGADFQNGEQVIGQGTGTAGALTLDNARSCWGRDIQVKPVEGKDYKEQIKVVFPVDSEEWVQYEKHHLKLRTDIPVAAQTQLRQSLATSWQQRREANACNITIYGRDNSTNARTRAQTLQTFLDQLFQQNVIVDRKAICEAMKAEIIQNFDGKSQKRLALLLVGETIWEYAAQQHPNDDGIFLLHVPGLFDGLSFTQAAANRQPKVMGAVYPELAGDGNAVPFRHRHRAIAYLATLPDGQADLAYPTKDTLATFKHELAHALFLPHAPGRTSGNTPSPHPECHVKGDSCLMNYDLTSKHFCGLCMLRLRGWDWSAEYLSRPVAIHILNGDAQTYLAAPGIQYVNLPAESKWVDGVNVTNTHRLGRKLRIKVEFAREVKDRKFSLQLLSHKDNVEYSGDEKGRNAAFNFVRAPASFASGDFTQMHGNEVTGVSNEQGEFISESDFELSPAGGDRYKFVAEDAQHQRVESVEITTKRLVYYMNLVSQEAAAIAVDRNTFHARVTAEYDKHHIKIIRLGDEVINGFPFWNIDSHDDFVASLETLTNREYVPGKRYSDHHPYLLRLVRTDQLVSAVTGMIFHHRPTTDFTRPILSDNRIAESVLVQAGPGAPATLDLGTIIFSTTGRTNRFHRSLFIGMGELRAAGVEKKLSTGTTWLVSAKFIPDDGSPEVAIPVANCVPIDDAHLPHNLTNYDSNTNAPMPITNNPGRHRMVRVTGLDSLLPVQKNGHVQLEVRYIVKYVAGQAKVGPGILLNCTRFEYSPKSANEQICISIHEMGHELGMNAGVNNSGLDPLPNYYEFNGSHCSHGLATALGPQFRNQAAAAQCVMYAEVLNPPQDQFCSECTKQLKRLDLSRGFKI